VNHNYRPDGKIHSAVAGVALAATLLVAIAPACFAKESAVDSATSAQDKHSSVTSDQFLELGVQGADSLRIEGEQALKMGKIDRAIIVLQQAVEQAPRDIDGRILYGEALEKKLMHQSGADRDPKLYNFTVKQWLFVAKGGQFADQSQQGFNHLYKLTGTLPRRFEKEKSFLERVLIPEDGSVAVTIGKRQGKGEGRSIARTKDKVEEKPL